MTRDAIRYQYEHSILPYDDLGSVWEGEQLKAGHRVSVMVRVSHRIG
jgi:alkylated DNA repair protein alkB family protein 7